MKKRIIAFAIIVALVLSPHPVMAFAYNAEEHDSYLEEVLFGEKNYKDSQPSIIKDKILMLEYASYLAIDQMDGNGSDKIRFLKEQKVRKVPKLEEFDLAGIFMGKHRNYTHRGWEYVYPIPKGEKRDKANWPVRKALLCSTVNKVFDFGFKNELFGNVCEKCNSFAALIYYVHILGDHLERENFKVEDLTIPLARDHASDTNPDVFWEIKRHCAVLFEGQKDSMTYSSFVDEQDELADKARTLAGSRGGINDANYREYKKCAEELMDLLSRYVPLLLENEDFFKAEFYSN